MNEATGRMSLPSTHSDAKSVTQRVYHTANILQVGFLQSSHYYNISTQVPSGDADLLLFAGQTVSGGSLVLLSLGLDTMVLTVNTEKIVLGNMLVKEIKTALEKQ